MAETLTTIEQYQAAVAIFEKLADRNSTVGDREPHDICRVFDVCVSDDDEHNCLGCVLKDRLEDIHSYLSLVCGGEGLALEEALLFQQFVGLLNSFWAVVLDAFKLVKHQRAISSTEDSPASFAAFQATRRWCNFFKHPGEFAHVIHHPRYIHEDTGSPLVHEIHQIVVDQQQVNLAWGSKWRDEDRWEFLRGPKDENGHPTDTVFSALVVLPNVATLSDQIFQEIIEIIDILTAPQHHRILNDKTSVSNYYAVLDSDETDVDLTSDSEATQSQSLHTD